MCGWWWIFVPHSYFCSGNSKQLHCRLRNAIHAPAAVVIYQGSSQQSDQIIYSGSASSPLWSWSCCSHLLQVFETSSGERSHPQQPSYPPSPPPPPPPRENVWVLPTAFWHYSLVTALEITTVFTILHGSAFHRPSFQQMSPNLPPSAQIAGIASVNAARRKKDQ